MNTKANKKRIKQLLKKIDALEKMLSHLNGGRADGTWERRLNTYLRPELLILDDFSLKSIQPPGPEDLYDVINERYEHGSILLTSNRAPSEWSDLFLESNQTGCHTTRWIYSASYRH